LQSEEFGVSKLALAVSGGLTDVMDIRLGLEGGAVQGRVLKLSSVDPFVVTPLPGAEVDLFPDAGDNQSATTDNSGNYSFPDVPQGLYDLNAEFSGELPVPGGGSEEKNLSDRLSGNINFAGDLEVKDFRFTGTGAVQVTVVDEFGDPVPFVDVNLEAFGGDLGGGFVAPPAQCSESTNSNGIATFSASRFSCFSIGADVRGVPLGPCEVHIGGFNNDNGNNENGIGTVGPEDGCFVNQHGELVELELTVEVVQPGDIDQVRVTQGEQGGEANIIYVNVDYSRDFPVDSSFDVFFVIDFDTPRITSGPNGDRSSVLIMIPLAEFIAFAGMGPYNTALLSEFGGGEIREALVEFGFGILDVVPNEGFVEVDLSGNQVFDDPLGDTFGGFSVLAD